MRFRSEVEPPQPMRGLEVPLKVIETLDAGQRPRVVITINGHSWHSRIAKMRGRYLIGLSKANRAAADVETGDLVEVDVEFDPEPPVVAEPEDLTRALDRDSVARAAWDRLSHSMRRRHVHAIESAKRPETRTRRVEKALGTLREEDSG